jgi:hypothetical protein
MRGVKQHIPLKVKREVWRRDFGASSQGHCSICSCTIGIPMCLGSSSYASAEFGHIQAEAKGGVVKPSNLELMCKRCNSSMGTMNALRFKEFPTPMCVDVDIVEIMDIDSIQCLSHLVSNKRCKNKSKNGLCHIHRDVSIYIARH